LAFKHEGKEAEGSIERLLNRSPDAGAKYWLTVVCRPPACGWKDGVPMRAGSEHLQPAEKTEVETAGRAAAFSTRYGLPRELAQSGNPVRGI